MCLCSSKMYPMQDSQGFSTSHYNYHLHPPSMCESHISTTTGSEVVNGFDYPHNSVNYLWGTSDPVVGEYNTAGYSAQSQEYYYQTAPAPPTTPYQQPDASWNQQYPCESSPALSKSWSYDSTEHTASGTNYFNGVNGTSSTCSTPVPNVPVVSIKQERDRLITSSRKWNPFREKSRSRSRSRSSEHKYSEHRSFRRYRLKVIESIKYHSRTSRTSRSRRHSPERKPHSTSTKHFGKQSSFDLKIPSSIGNSSPSDKSSTTSSSLCSSSEKPKSNSDDHSYKQTSKKSQRSTSLNTSLSSERIRSRSKIVNHHNHIVRNGTSHHKHRRHTRSRSRSRSRQKSIDRRYSLPKNESRPIKRESISNGQYSKHSRSSPLAGRLESRRVVKAADAEPNLSKGVDHENEDLDDSTSIEKWVRSAPAELYYSRDNGAMRATERTKLLCEKFDTNLLERASTARLAAEKEGADKMKELTFKETDEYGDGDSSSSDSDDSDAGEEKSKPSRTTAANRELERRKLHPKRLHRELWHNDPGLMNDGPVCRCSAKAKRFGIRHGFYPGEDVEYKCDPYSNNPTQLFHYRITISPEKNFLVNSPSLINHDGHDYWFEGFSLLSHYELDLKLPPCKVIRFNIRYDVFVEVEPYPESFCVKELVLFETYLFRELLELVDLKHDWEQKEGCSQFHLMPRFVRKLPDNGKEILSMNRVLLHLLKNDKELVREEDLTRLLQVEQKEWQHFADKHKGMIVTKWGMKPCALRADQIDRDITFGKDAPPNNEKGIPYPLIVHFGIRPPQLSYAGNSAYQRAWRRYVKYRHLLSNMPKPSIEEKRKLVAKDLKLRQMRTASTMKRDVTVDIPAIGFRTTGISCDIVQHAMLIPVLVGHLRFHKSLVTLEQRLQYTFQNPYLLQLAMTHPSYRENFGTNPDHARNALTNCGIRQPEYGDRRIHYSSTRKRGINTLINIMARFGAEDETESEITHNERLEFLGDAVVEFATSIHLFHLFPDLEEGGLATYRAAIVQNQHLAELAQNLQLDQFMLYAHGSDLCHDSELRHAMANCFEALMGAIFLDGGIEVADRIFGKTLYGHHSALYDTWTNYPKHPLQVQEPQGDRHWLNSHGGVLKKLTEFEELIGLEFTHIRLLARAFTDRSLGYNHLSRGSNQRLEFLGDTVLQLISSEYLYRHFPDHHEGHLSLLRSSLVNNRTQSLVCDDLGMTNYAMRGDPKLDLKTKDRADLLEAFLGALYIDKGLKFCIVFCSVCFIPRLSTSIIKQEWNDPKSKLQQCCLTLRTMDGNEPDIPVYKITESKGPTNTRVYVVAVFFRGRRLATAEGHSIQEAEMNAAANALRESEDLFPQLSHQKRIIDKTNKKPKHHSRN